MVFGSHFIFDGIDSRDYNLILCSFDGTQNEDLSMGLGIEAITTELPDRTIDYGGKWNECLTFDFSITHGYEALGQPFSRKEVREIVHWLTSSKELKWLSFFQEEEQEYWYFCRFTNIELKKLGGDIIGFHLEVTCDSPFAYSEIKTVKLCEADIVKDSNSMSGITSDLVRIPSDTDVPVCPNIFVEVRGFGKLEKPLTFCMRNEFPSDRHTHFQVYNFPNMDSAERNPIMIDLNNWVLCGYQKENEQLLPDYSIIYEKSLIQNLNIHPESKLIELVKGVNIIEANLDVVGGIFPEDNFTQCDWAVYIQYREKYKVGVF